MKSIFKQSNKLSNMNFHFFVFGFFFLISKVEGSLQIKHAIGWESLVGDLLGVFAQHRNRESGR